MYVALAWLALLLAPGAAPQQSAKAPPPVTLLDITLEQRNADGTARPVAPDHVFKEHDVVRFRIASRVDGFLYVSNQSTSGRYSTVFPSADVGSDNRIRSGEKYLVPATSDGWFEIEGPPGFEMLYFLVSPVALGAPARPASVAPGPLSSLKPRCNDAIFRARGECVDGNAGPHAAPPDDQLPAELKDKAGTASRDIVFTKKDNGTAVASSGPMSAPVIYTFRLAHQ